MCVVCASVQVIAHEWNRASIRLFVCCVWVCENRENWTESLSLHFITAWRARSALIMRRALFYMHGRFTFNLNHISLLKFVLLFCSVLFFLHLKSNQHCLFVPFVLALIPSMLFSFLSIFYRFQVFSHKIRKF